MLSIKKITLFGFLSVVLAISGYFLIGNILYENNYPYKDEDEQVLNETFLQLWPDNYVFFETFSHFEDSIFTRYPDILKYYNEDSLYNQYLLNRHIRQSPVFITFGLKFRRGFSYGLDSFIQVNINKRRHYSFDKTKWLNDSQKELETAMDLSKIQFHFNGRLQLVENSRADKIEVKNFAGYISISKIFYNADHNLACYYTERLRPGGFIGQSHFLRKINHRWVIECNLMEWVS